MGDETLSVPRALQALAESFGQTLSNFTSRPVSLAVDSLENKSPLTLAPFFHGTCFVEQCAIGSRLAGLCWLGSDLQYLLNLPLLDEAEILRKLEEGVGDEDKEMAGEVFTMLWLRSVDALADLLSVPVPMEHKMFDLFLLESGGRPPREIFPEEGGWQVTLKTVISSREGYVTLLLSDGAAGLLGLEKNSETVPDPLGEAATVPVSVPPPASGGSRPVDLVERLLKIPVPVKVLLAEKRIKLEDILQVGIGSVVEFNKGCETLLEIIVNNEPIGLGETVKVGDKFGIHVKKLCSREAIVKFLGPPSPILTP